MKGTLLELGLLAFLIGVAAHGPRAEGGLSAAAGLAPGREEAPRPLWKEIGSAWRALGRSIGSHSPRILPASAGESKEGPGPRSTHQPSPDVPIITVSPVAPAPRPARTPDSPMALYYGTPSRRGPDPLGRLHRVDAPGIQPLRPYQYRGHRVQVGKRKLGVTVKREQFSATVQGLGGKPVAFLDGMNTAQRARAAAEEWIDRALEEAA